MYRSAFLSLGLLACACNAESQAPQDEGLFAPQEGEWAVDAVTLDDGCELYDEDIVYDEDEDEDAGILIRLDEDNLGFSMLSAEDDSTIITCVLEGRDFSCELPADATDVAQLGETDYRDQGYDIVLTGEMTVDGYFSSATEAEFSSVLSYTCAGSDCAAHGIADGCQTSITTELYAR